jgi:predicted CoA-binding protein
MLARSSIDAFLAQRRLAVVGVGTAPNDFPTAIVKAFLEHDYDVVPVGRHVVEVEGVPAFTSLAAVPGPVDGVVVMVRADAALDVVREAVDRGVPRVWLFKGAGRGALSPEAVEYARAHGVDVVEGACPLMFLPPVRNVHRLHRFMSRRVRKASKA